MLDLPLVVKTACGTLPGFADVLGRDRGVVGLDLGDQECRTRLGFWGQARCGTFGLIGIVEGQGVPEIEGHGPGQ